MRQTNLYDAFVEITWIYQGTYFSRGIARRRADRGQMVEILRPTAQFMAAEPECARLVWNEIADFHSQMQLPGGLPVGAARLPRYIDTCIDEHGAPCLVREHHHGELLTSYKEPTNQTLSTSAHEAVGLVESIALTMSVLAPLGLPALSLSHQDICLGPKDPSGHPRSVTLLGVEEAYLLTRLGRQPGRRLGYAALAEEQAGSGSTDMEPIHQAHDIAWMGKLLADLSAGRYTARLVGAAPGFLSSAQQLIADMQASSPAHPLSLAALLSRLASLRKQLGPLEIHSFVERGHHHSIYLAYHAESRSLNHARVFEVAADHQQSAAQIVSQLALLKPLRAEYARPLIAYGQLESGEPYSLWAPDPDEESLEKTLGAARNWQLESALLLGKATLECLIDAHQHGLIVRTVAPQMLGCKRTQNGARIRLLDNVGAQPSDARAVEPAHQQRWLARLAPGVRAYLAPENVDGRSVLMHSADVFGVGAILISLLTATLLTGEATDAVPAALAAVLRHAEEHRGLWLLVYQQLAAMVHETPSERPSCAKALSSLSWLLLLCRCAQGSEDLGGRYRCQQLLAADMEVATFEVQRHGNGSRHIAHLYRYEHKLPLLYARTGSSGLARIEESGRHESGGVFVVFRAEDGLTLMQQVLRGVVVREPAGLAALALPSAEVLAGLHAQATIFGELATHQLLYREHDDSAAPSLRLACAYNPGELRRLRRAERGSEGQPQDKQPTAPGAFQSADEPGLSDKTDVYQFALVLLPLAGQATSLRSVKQLGDRRLEKLLAQMLDPRPSHRPPMSEVVRRLRQLQEKRPQWQMSPLYPLGAAALSALIGGGYWLHQRLAVYQVRIESDPPALLRYEDNGRELGPTPLDVKLPRSAFRGGQLRVSVSKSGYYPATARIAEGQDYVKVQLKCSVWDIRSTPNQAHVTIGSGEETLSPGSTPLTIDCGALAAVSAERPVVVKLTHSGCEPQNFRLSTLQDQHINVTLSCATPPVALSVLPLLPPPVPPSPPVSPPTKPAPKLARTPAVEHWPQVPPEPCCVKPDKSPSADNVMLVKLQALTKALRDPGKREPPRTEFCEYASEIVDHKLRKSSCEVVRDIVSRSNILPTMFEPKITASVLTYYPALVKLCSGSPVETAVLSLYKRNCDEACRKEYEELERQRAEKKIRTLSFNHKRTRGGQQ